MIKKLFLNINPDFALAKSALPCGLGRPRKSQGDFRELVAVIPKFACMLLFKFCRRAINSIANFGIKKRFAPNYLHTSTLTHFHTKKSQAMFFTLFILAVFGALAGGLAVMWESEIRTRSSDQDSLNAFYLAQAGIERAKKSGVSSPWIVFGAGRYQCSVIGTNLSSIGQVRDASGNILAERRIAVTVNAGFTSQNPWTWRET